MRTITAASNNLARKPRPMQRGKILFFTDRSKKEPRCKGCVTYSLFHDREDPRERGGWWALCVGESIHTTYAFGPYITEVEATAKAKQQAECHRCTYLP
jgi:hypothetical protein